MSNLNLKRVPEIFRDRATDSFEKGDITAILSKMDNMVAPGFVFDNLLVLRKAGLLEKAIIETWSMMRVNSHHTGNLFEFLFRFADREKLFECGDPLPGPGPYTLYRGCSGKARARKVRGFSWTAAYDRAQWFAKRFGLPDPAVYRIEAPISWILAYLNENFRNEEEFLVLVPRQRRIVRI